MKDLMIPDRIVLHEEDGCLKVSTLGEVYLNAIDALQLYRWLRKYLETLVSNLPINLINKIELQDNDCWFWTGKLHKGQCTFYVGNKNLTVRRLIWKALKGPLSPNIRITVSCSNECCVNPAHLIVKEKKNGSL